MYRCREPPRTQPLIPNTTYREPFGCFPAFVPRPPSPHVRFSISGPSHRRPIALSDFIGHPLFCRSPLSHPSQHRSAHCTLPVAKVTLFPEIEGASVTRTPVGRGQDRTGEACLVFHVERLKKEVPFPVLSAIAVLVIGIPRIRYDKSMFPKSFLD